MTSEFDLIGRYFSRHVGLPGLLGVGDDCAGLMVSPGMQLVTSTDMLIEGRHFFPDVDPVALGHKTLAVNLSDLAAMGARPRGFLLGLGLPGIDPSWVAAFADGLYALADRSHCPLIGGDTVQAPVRTFSVTVFGEVDPTLSLRRDRAREGDDIWVSGALGEADVALSLMLGRLPADAQRLAATRRALEWPEPQLALGEGLLGLAHAAIDVSDGLLQDLRHVLKASGVGARLHIDLLPIAASLDGLSDRVRSHAALGGGDLYQLCFTAAAARHADVRALASRLGLPLTRIGDIVAGADCEVLDASGQVLTDLPGGFDHFQATH